MNIRSLVVFLSVVVSCSAACQAAAQDSTPFPNRSVRIIHIAPGGAGLDIITRAIAQELSAFWKQPVLVEPRPGANGILAVEACVKAPSDGSTLCMVSRSQVSLLPHIQAKLPYNTEKDLAPIGRLFDSVSALFAGSQLPFSSVSGLVEYSRAKTGQLNFGTPSDASLSLLLFEALRKTHEIEMTPVPYKGVIPMVQALVTGEIQLTHIGVSATVGPLRAGKVKALAQSGDKRSNLLPDVPTFKQAGLGDLDDSWWFGIFGPRDLETAIRDKIFADVSRIFGDPAFVTQRLESNGWIPALLSPKEFASFISSDRTAVANLVRTYGFQSK